MKFLHLSDLHIGKMVNGFSMLEDQKVILSQIISLAFDHQVQAVFISGDLYDRAVAPAVAVEVFDQFLTELIKGGVLVFAIGGNHDCGQRISFASDILKNQGLYLEGIPKRDVVYYDFQDINQTVRIHLLPFARPSEVKYLYGKEVGFFEESVRVQLEHVSFLEDGKNILLTHHFVVGKNEETLTCDSDSRILVGGADQVDVSCFQQFDYVALGHLHSPQQIGKGPVYYAGSPLKYSFSEADHEKAVIIGEIDQEGVLKVERCTLNPLHDMRKIMGELKALIRDEIVTLADPEDYILAVLTNEAELIDPIGTLRSVYPNIMQIQFEKNLRKDQEVGEKTITLKGKSVFEQFSDFFLQVMGKDLDENQKSVLLETIDRAREVEE